MAHPEQKFFICRICGNIIGLIHDSGIPIECCGEEMEELIPNTVDAAQEKHVPAFTVAGNQIDVQIGSVEHPMEKEHYIEWIYLKTEHGGQRRGFIPGEKPQATFLLAEGEKPVAVYAYCNLHGLWKTDI